MKTIQTLLTAAIMFTVASATQAALIPALGGQVVNDTDRNITWLANANLAATNTFGVSGILGGGYMTWWTAQQWIAGMNAANYLGYSDWRLPTTLQPDASCSFQSGSSAGYNCIGSEMGHLFYNELGGVATHSITTTHNANYGLFQNVQSGYYWSGTENASYTISAWNFNFDIGNQGPDGKTSLMHALAVRPGQVVATPVPGAVWLLGSGLLGLIGVARRKTA